MPYFTQRTLYISLSGIVLIFVAALALSSRPNLNTLSIPSPFSRAHNQSPHQVQQPTWLLGTMSPYFSQQRRNIIRATWQTLYSNPAFDTRFFIAKPAPHWQSLIKFENDTYGDLIVLEDLEEIPSIAKYIKVIEFWKHMLARSQASGAEAPSWKFVSEIDDDSFVDAERFYHEYLRPRMDRHATPVDQSGTLIARRLKHHGRNYSIPGGQFYTLSWDLASLVIDLQNQRNLTDVVEDVLVGRLLYDANVQFDFVELDDTRAFDVTENLTRLSLTHEDLGPMDEAAINPHRMKDDETYLRVASLFGKDGFVGTSSDEGN